MNFFAWLGSLLKRQKPFTLQENQISNSIDQNIKQTVPTPSLTLHSLDQKQDSFFITQRSDFVQDGILKEKTIKDVFDFAYKMAFSDEGEHRDKRSGGSHHRKPGEIFANTFQGKIAECAACNFFHKHNYDKTVFPDFSVFKLGKWDSVDITACDNEIAVKSTKSFGQLILLETKDWDSNGHYIPNIENGISKYDCLMLIRIKPSCEEILKDHRLLYSYTADYEKLYSIISEHSWSYNYAGFITYDDLLQIIHTQQVLPKGSKLNGKTVMDAENYYIQAGDLRKMETFEEVYL